MFQSMTLMQTPNGRHMSFVSFSRAVFPSAHFTDSLLQNHDTECKLRNDILRKHGVIPEKPPSPTPMIEEALIQARELAHENRLEGKDLDELDELEDDEDEDFLNQYRYVKEIRIVEQGILMPVVTGKSA